MIKLFTLFIVFNLSSLNFVQASEVLQTTDLQAPETSQIQKIEVSQTQTAKTKAEASVWDIYNNEINGTGFFIDSNLFVTNFHIIDDLLKANNFYLSQEGNSNILHIKQIVAVSVLYDLALIEIKESSPHYLTLSENEVKINDELFSISYPNEIFTKIKKTGNILYEDNQSFSFPTNHSEPHGASGSPVLNKQGQVVGVLFKGYRKHSLYNKNKSFKKFDFRKYRSKL